MFRSEDMVLCEVIFTQETMWKTMNYLARCERIMFVEKEADLVANPTTLKSYAKNMVRRCQELLDFLDEIWGIMGRFKLQEGPIGEDLRRDYDLLDSMCKDRRIEGGELFEEYEHQLKNNFDALNKHLETRKTLLQKNLEDHEQLDALRNCHRIIPEDFSRRETLNQPNRLEAFYGLVPTSELAQIQKVLFRLTKGNIIFETVNLDNSKYFDEEEKDLAKVNKTLLFLLSPGGVDHIMGTKIERLLFMSEFQKLEIPFEFRRQEMELHLEQEINDNEKVLRNTDQEIKFLLGQFIKEEDISRMSFYKTARLVVSREMTFARKLVYVEKRDVLYSLMFWLPKKNFTYTRFKVEEIETKDEKTLKPKLLQYRVDDLSQLKTKKPPTYFELNALTAPFQEIVDTYGVPRYKEVNPGLFTVISFPFFFGLMFGDVGHGSIVLILGIIMLALCKDPKSPLYKMKYLVFLNGIFATYCGFIYSEWFANAFAFFPSCYDVKSPTFAIKSKGCVYPFGLDYIWYISENETSFLNSFKMKFSIIIGVVQMLFGTILRASNGIYFGKWEDVVFEAIPQFLFMLVTFGYMSVAIIIKWLTNWDGRESVSIIQVFINFMSVEQPLYGDGQLQDTLQKIFLVICVICFFMMLCFKPCIVFFRQKKENQSKSEKYRTRNNSEGSDSADKILSKLFSTCF